jgi:hypothetical protein
VSGLAGDLRRLLVDEPVGLSCDELAKRLHRRRADVLAELRRDWRFEHVAAGSASRWRRRGRIRDGRGAPELPWLELDTGVPIVGRRAPESAS